MYMALAGKTRNENNDRREIAPVSMFTFFAAYACKL